MSIDTTFTKACTKCGEVKGAEGFGVDKTTKDGLRQRCKSCLKAHRTSPEFKAARIKAIAKIDFTTYTKACSTCKEVKGAEGFSSRKDTKDGLKYYCKSCEKAYKTSPEFIASRAEAVAKIDFATYTKACSTCKEVKGAEKFSRDKRSKDGLVRECKSCVKVYATAYRDANRAELAAWQVTFRASPEGKAKRAAYAATPAAKASYAKYVKANAGKFRAKQAKRRAAQIERTPDWLTNDELDYMKSIYAIAVEAQKIEGEEKHVDHLVPLRGEDVSGLHVPWNLVLLPAIDNIKKSNKFCIDEYNARWHNT